MATRKVELSPQDKLALALTSAGSVRELARRIGITHQKLGRWLREGEPDGIKAIPADIFTHQAIEEVFKAHKSEAFRRAKLDRIPIDPQLPVYAQRKPLRTGEMGDRVFVTQTQFIRPETRKAVLQSVADSKKFYSASVRSTVKLRSYFRGRAKDELERGRRRHISEARLADVMMREFIARERVRTGREIDPQRPFPLYTEREGLMIGRKGDPLAVRGIETQMRQKHSPATGERGTVEADQYLFQLTPENYVPPPPRRKPKRRK